MLSTAGAATTAIMAALILCSLVGNSVVILVVFRSRNSLLRKPVHILIANLAICDALFSLFLVPRFILIHAYEHPRGVAGEYLCKLINGGNLTWVGGAASVFTLASIAMERFYAVVHPHRISKRFTLAKTKLVIIVSWSVSLLLNVPLFVTTVYSVDQDFCIESWQHIDLSKIYSTGWFVGVGVIPFSFMAYAYSRVIVVLWGRHTSSAIHQRVLYRSRKKVTKIALLVTGVYLVTWFPGLVYYMLVTYLDDQFRLGSVIHRINQMLTLINAASNPFIYAFQSKVFRRSVLKMLCCGHVLKKNPVDPVSKVNHIPLEVVPRIYMGCVCF